MPYTSPEDKRRFTRFSLVLPVRYLNLTSNKEGKARMRDLSDKGLGLLTNEGIAIDTKLDLWLQMPDGGCFYTRGQVAWSHKVSEPDTYLIGVNLGEAELKSVQLVIKAMQSRFSL